MRCISILDILEKTAAELPNKTYVLDEWGSLSYGACVRQARWFGWHLSRFFGGSRQRAVVLFMEKSRECVTAMLGALYGGCFYVPVDTHMPKDRLLLILQTLGEAVLVTCERDKKTLLDSGYTGDYLLFEALASAPCAQGWQEDMARLRERLVDSELMYVLFTSGSTGVPKGLAVRHRSVVDYVEAFCAVVNVEPFDIHGNQAPFYVTMSLKDLFMTMRVGATICLIPQRLFATPKRLLAYLDEHQVTTLMWVPTAYRVVSQFDALASAKPRALKKFLFSGEATPIEVYTYWRRHYPQATFTQQYGSTETTGACCSYTVPAGRVFEGSLPIGKALPNAGVVLLDEHDCLIDPKDQGVEGEICVFGSCLSAGYYNDPQKTQATFVQSPLVSAYPEPMLRTGDMGFYNDEGNLVFGTRKDDQVKLGGHRVELGDVERAFSGMAGCGACACVLDSEQRRLVLFFVGDVSQRELRAYARTKLPKYMIPTAYQRIKTLPQLSGGKLDRKTLQAWAREL